MMFPALLGPTVIARLPTVSGAGNVYPRFETTIQYLSGLRDPTLKRPFAAVYTVFTMMPVVPLFTVTVAVLRSAPLALFTVPLIVKKVGVAETGQVTLSGCNLLSIAFSTTKNAPVLI